MHNKDDCMHEFCVVFCWALVYYVCLSFNKKKGEGEFRIVLHINQPNSSQKKKRDVKERFLPAALFAVESPFALFVAFVLSERKRVFLFFFFFAVWVSRVSPQ